MLTVCPLLIQKNSPTISMGGRDDDDGGGLFSILLLYTKFFVFFFFLNKKYFATFEMMQSEDNPY